VKQLGSVASGLSDAKKSTQYEIMYTCNTLKPTINEYNDCNITQIFLRHFRVCDENAGIHGLLDGVADSATTLGSFVNNFLYFRKHALE
jgi:hypothetical protein